MVLTTLGRTAARSTALGRAALAARPRAPAPMVLARRFKSDYDWNLGVPGSRIRNPAPKVYNDQYPDQGKKWWALLILSTLTWISGNMYDTSRGVNIAIGIFGPNLPL
eukprot:CAMPEP_0170288650 /NCGR_PEP_ID=MMETSP0116_2-20130129/44386_1 /TAXON_ID=400756 /ORGANISM="Durinskia baltica, Strain CSIRO CS-38" /LENGTH=107 /DNA_ID=CAMNT_0010540075 /DNA_START=93 /DNA_END=416 /DNA_ORIENTATION=+